MFGDMNYNFENNILNQQRNLALELRDGVINRDINLVRCLLPQMSVRLINYSDRFGFRPLDHAIFNNDNVMEALLRRYGARQGSLIY